jgi:hypothetical protein
MDLQRLWCGCGAVVVRLWCGCGAVVVRLWCGCERTRHTYARLLGWLAGWLAGSSGPAAEGLALALLLRV